MGEAEGSQPRRLGRREREGEEETYDLALSRRRRRSSEVESEVESLDGGEMGDLRSQEFTRQEVSFLRSWNEEGSERRIRTGNDAASTADMESGILATTPLLNRTYSAYDPLVAS